MDPSVEDFLLTVAEVAVAGFAGLVTVLARRVTESDRDLDIVRLRDLLLLSLLAGAFALFPKLPVAFGADEETTWRVSAGLFALAWAGFGVQGIWAGWRLARAGTRPFAKPLFWSNLVVHVPCTVALVCVAAGAEFVAGFRPGVYLAVLFALLYLAGAYFVALFVSLARG